MNYKNKPKKKKMIIIQSNPSEHSHIKSSEDGFSDSHVSSFAFLCYACIQFDHKHIYKLL
jgi:hypothetical protein